jgi:hypothetical protein
MKAVANVDSRLYKLADFTGNLAADTEANSSDTSQHGTMVSSIIGAVGNNSKGMTGMLWTTQMGFFNTTKVVAHNPPPAYQWLALERAGTAYPVVNVSLGLYWQKAFGHLPNPSSHMDSVTALDIKDQFETVILAMTGLTRSGRGYLQRSSMPTTRSK